MSARVGSATVAVHPGQGRAPRGDACSDRATNPNLLANLAYARAGGHACPCVLAMGCPLHFCGCWNYRMPWECDCDDREAPPC